MIDQKNLIYTQNHLTISSLAKKFNTFSSEEIKVICNMNLANKKVTEFFEFAQYLFQEYKFNKLILKDEEKQSHFSFAMAQCWLYTRLFLPNEIGFSFANCFISPLSVILTTDYQLNIDEIEIIELLTENKLKSV